MRGHSSKSPRSMRASTSSRRWSDAMASASIVTIRPHIAHMPSANWWLDATGCAGHPAPSHGIQIGPPVTTHLQWGAPRRGSGRYRASLQGWLPTLHGRSGRSLPGTTPPPRTRNRVQLAGTGRSVGTSVPRGRLHSPIYIEHSRLSSKVFLDSFTPRPVVATRCAQCRLVGIDGVCRADVAAGHDATTNPLSLTVHPAGRVVQMSPLAPARLAPVR